MMSTQARPFQRLPGNVKPINYKTEIEPDIDTFTFNGKQDITVEILETTNSVTFNCNEIDIKSVVYVNSGGKNVESSSVNVDEQNEVVTVTFPESLPIGGTGVLRMEFQGHINDKLRGFYRSKYTSIDGTEKYAAVTQFEATDARRCFPCWDEPALRATFDITLVVPKDLLALSNMPVKSSTPVASSNKICHVFDTTPIMSTYLVAMIVGEFDYIQEYDSDGVCVRVYTPKGKTEQGVFALHVASKVLPYCKSYFGIPYPLPKMDLIAIPDFAAGAMENWGLVTYRETRLLVDPDNTSAVSRQHVALSISHELAHQWFGNLVTMEWWTHLWLKEGYASFLEFLCVDLLFPEYDIWTQFVTDMYTTALELDALKNSHAIEVPVGHPDEIDEIFDDISYNKGACVIRMLHSYIGDDCFRKGMALYLKRHMYAHAKTEDLWLALEESSNKSIRHVMSSWTKQQGFPLLTVSEKSCDGNKRVLSISQERFLADGSVDANNSLWVIPIAISCSDNPDKVIKNEIMETKTKDIEIEGVAQSAWIKVNPGAVGVYRTLYSNQLLESLLPAIENQSLPPLDRLNLLNDLFALSQAGKVSSSQILKLLKAFKSENNCTVWTSIRNCLSKFSVLLAHLDVYSKYKSFGRSLLQDIHDYLGWDTKDNENHLDTLLRSLVLGRLVAFEDEAVIAEANRRFEAHIFGKAILPADLRNCVYRAVFASGGPDMFETFVKLYHEADLHEEKVRILCALGATNDKDMLKRVLEFSISDEVKHQDMPMVIMSVSSSYEGRVIAWKFLKENYSLLTERYKSISLLAAIVKCTSEKFAEESYAQEIEQFFKANPTKGIERTVQQSIENIKLNVAWLKRDEKAIRDFLDNID
ncbi:puromycin-sensitive aminopeptidase [Copidosoma floridanum]|uniref:puromycin-sensitive aminopeptidase n=1 Tax=Copidosoma floridanum TaxID=29053 RepID=UPI0006C97D4E|nr:puromycin-sensitive aminopeptidase [Copidosoma floridanum]